MQVEMQITNMQYHAVRQTYKYSVSFKCIEEFVSIDAKVLTMNAACGFRSQSDVGNLH